MQIRGHIMRRFKPEGPHKNKYLGGQRSIKYWKKFSHRKIRRWIKNHSHPIRAKSLIKVLKGWDD